MQQGCQHGEMLPVLIMSLMDHHLEKNHTWIAGKHSRMDKIDQRLIVIEVSQTHCVLSGSLMMDDGAIATCLRPPRMLRILVSPCGPLTAAETNDS